MNNRETEESMLQEILDRASACEVSDDVKNDEYLKLCAQAAQIRSGINERDRIENQFIIDCKKLELEQAKLEKEQKWLDPKFLIPIMVPVVFGAIDTVYRSWFTANMLRDVGLMEEKVIVTSGTPGKWVVRSIQDFFTPRKRV